MNRTLACLCTALCAGTIPAQMSGTYFINPAGGATTFHTFSEAVSALFVNGVSGPVQIMVFPGTYTESVLIPPISGASASNTITFQSLLGQGTVLLHGNGGDNFALLAVRFAHNIGMVFDGLDVVDAPGFAFSGTHFVEAVEIEHCVIGPNHISPGGYPGRALIFSDNDFAEAGWHVHHNQMTFPAGNSGYGLYISNGGGWEIDHNSIDLGGCDHGLYLINNNQRFDSIWDNLFFGSLVNAGGTYASNVSVISVDVSNFNNDIVHNTFLVTIPGSGCIIANVGYPPGGSLDINRTYGNIFGLTGGGTCISVTSYQSPPVYSFLSEGNLFWLPNGGEFGRLDPSQPGFTTLASWQAASGQDNTSITGDPLFVQGSTAPYDLHILPTSPARDAAVNTPPYVTTDFDGRIRDASPDIGAYETTSFAVYGQGCAGTAGLIPVIGGSGPVAIPSPTFAITLANARANAFSLLIGGSSRTNSGSLQLPYDIGGGCFVLASPDGSRSVTTDGAGNATAAMPIPNSQTLIGVNLFFQWVVIDPNSGSQFGLAVSNGGALQL